MAQLSYAKYGKDNVRLYKVVRHQDAGTQDVYEFTVNTMLEGDIETSYTQADNSVVVPTDTQKQTTYILAKQHPVSPPEVFGALLADHFIKRYSHIHVAHVNIIQHRWTRMTIDGKPHPHSFFRDGQEKRTIDVTATEGQGIAIRSGITDLLVLKSTGSAFYGYDTADSFTRLPETRDRILSTEVECGWKWERFADLAAVQQAAAHFNPAWGVARSITMDLFAKENSPSVQATMYKMCEEIIKAVPTVREVDYTLPNKHYFEVDLSWHEGLKNTGEDAEVYAPQTDPNGLIHCVVSRK